MRSRICFRISLALILVSLFVFPALAAGDGYVLVSGKAETGIITLFDMTGSGQLSVRSSQTPPGSDPNKDPQATVATRGLRLPRYAVVGKPASPSGYNAIYADGAVTLIRGEYPMVRVDRRKFVDQYLVARARAVESGTNLATKEVLAVVPLRP